MRGAVRWRVVSAQRSSCSSGPSQSADTQVLEHCASVMEATFEKCTDGIDNDNNGFVDCEDYSCSQHLDLSVRVACQESVGETCDQADAQCSDGVDNDADGFVDCVDWDCSWNPMVSVCNDKPKVCE